MNYYALTAGLEKIPKKHFLPEVINSINEQNPLQWEIYNIKSYGKITNFWPAGSPVPDCDERFTDIDKPLEDIANGFAITYEDIKNLDSYLTQYIWLLLMGYAFNNHKPQVLIEIIDSDELVIETASEAVYNILKEKYSFLSDAELSTKNIWRYSK